MWELIQDCWKSIPHEAGWENAKSAKLSSRQKGATLENLKYIFICLTNFWLLRFHMCYFIVLMSSLIFYNIENSLKKRKTLEWVGVQTWLVLYMCAIQMVNGQDKIFKSLWVGYGSRCQVHQFVSRTATLLFFFSSTASCVYQEWSTTQRPSSQLDTTVGSIGIMGQHPCGTLSTPCRVHALANWGCSEGKRGCNSILERCS